MLVPGVFVLYNQPLGSISQPLLLDDRMPAALAEDLASLRPWKLVKTPRLGCCRKSSRDVESGSAVIITGPAASSLDVAWKLNEICGLQDWDTVLCLSQWAGRGQLRRNWVSPPGNLYAAIAWPDPMGHPPQIAALLIGFVLAQALEMLTDVNERIELKWPNDIVWRGLKVGGVLLEDRTRLMAGVGINLCWAPDEKSMRTNHSMPAGMFDAGGLGPLRVWLSLLPHVRRLWDTLVVGHATLDVMAALEKRLAWRGLRVIVHNHENFDKERGIIVGVSADGGLRLAFPQGERLIHSGSISLEP